MAKNEIYEFPLKVLPVSNGRYYLSKFGDIIDYDLRTVETVVHKGRKMVSLDWVEGKKLYDVAMIVVLVKFSIKLPVQHWGLIEAIHRDGNVFNTHQVNLAYRFRNGPIEVEDLPSYYYVPYYTRYAINRFGMLINLVEKNHLTWNVTKPQVKKNIKGGYCFCGAVRDSGTSAGLMRHRALALAFLRYESSPFELVVNHKNGIPGSDDLFNLEWCTRAQNNQHAYDTGLLPNKLIDVTAKNLWSGKIEECRSLKAASELTGLSELVIAYRLKQIPALCYEDGWLFKRGKEEVWPEVNPLFRSSGRASTCHVLAKDVFTGDLIQFSSITHAAKDLELAPSAILDCVKTEGVRPLRGYVFRYRTPEAIWPSYSDKDLKVYRLCPIRNGSAVIEYDEMGNEVNFFETIKIAAQRLSTSASTVERECRGLKTPLTGKKFISFYEPPGTFKSRSPAQVTE